MHLGIFFKPAHIIKLTKAAGVLRLLCEVTHAAYSGPIWPPILELSGHWFRNYLASDSGISWSV